MAWTQILAICALWPWLWQYDLGLWHLGSWTTIIWSISYGADANFIYTCSLILAIWPWVKVMSPLGHKVNISMCSLKCEVKVTKFCVGQEELVNLYKLIKFDLCIMNGLWGTKLNANCWRRTYRRFSPIHRPDLLCNPVKNYLLDMNFGYMCTGIWPWIKVMTHPWVIDTFVE